MTVEKAPVDDLERWLEKRFSASLFVPGVARRRHAARLPATEGLASQLSFQTRTVPDLEAESIILCGVVAAARQRASVDRNPSFGCIVYNQTHAR